jgi:hypothetical protein
VPMPSRDPFGPSCAELSHGNSAEEAVKARASIDSKALRPLKLSTGPQIFSKIRNRGNSWQACEGERPVAVEARTGEVLNERPKVGYADIARGQFQRPASSHKLAQMAIDYVVYLT